MSSKNKYGKFKKKDYLRTLREYREYFCGKFGYLIMPFLIETRLSEGCLMMFMHHCGAAAIFYDYKQFKDEYGKESFEVQKIYAASLLAHEMRHYYQYRQMYAKKPRESAEILARWKGNENNSIEIDQDVVGYFFQPLELDASLFEYVFCAETFGVVLTDFGYNDEKYFNALEALYVEYFGETDEKLFQGEIREKLLGRYVNNDEAENLEK
jgi:hypothetical protein